MKVFNDGDKTPNGKICAVAECPACGESELDYGTLTPSDNQIYYPWTCTHCKAEGQEWYNIEFVGQNLFI